MHQVDSVADATPVADATDTIKGLYACEVLNVGNWYYFHLLTSNMQSNRLLVEKNIWIFLFISTKCVCVADATEYGPSILKSEQL